MCSPDFETSSNTLVLVGHGISGDLYQMEQMKISERHLGLPENSLTTRMFAEIPHNVLVIDTSIYERVLFNSGARGPMKDPSGQPRTQGSTLSLMNLLLSLGVDIQCQMHNSGNDAYMTLLALQLLLDPHNTKIPSMRGRATHPGMMISRATSRSPAPGVPMMSLSASMPVLAPFGFSPVVPSIGFPSPGSSSPDPENATNWRNSGYAAAMQHPQSLNGRPRNGSGLNPNNLRRPDDRRRTVSDQEVTSRLGGLKLG